MNARRFTVLAWVLHPLDFLCHSLRSFPFTLHLPLFSLNFMYNSLEIDHPFLFRHVSSLNECSQFSCTNAPVPCCCYLMLLLPSCSADVFFLRFSSLFSALFSVVRVGSVGQWVTYCLFLCFIACPMHDDLRGFPPPLKTVKEASHRCSCSTHSCRTA